MDNFLLFCYINYVKYFLHVSLLLSLLFLCRGELLPTAQNKIKNPPPRTIAGQLSSPTLQKKILKHLRQIYTEVKEMGLYPGENFIKQEFFIEIDGRRENKEEQVVVLIQHHLNLEKMLIQITTFSALKTNTLRLAVSTKKITCAFFQQDLALTGTDYSEKETCHLLQAILKGIRQEKKILSLIKKQG